MVREIGINTSSEVLRQWLKDDTEKLGQDYLDDERKQIIAADIMRIAFELYQRDQMSEWTWQQNRKWCQAYTSPLPQPAGV